MFANFLIKHILKETRLNNDFSTVLNMFLFLYVVFLK